VGEKSFLFTFLDQQFQAQYLEDEQRGRFFALFSGVTVFIACIGLAGLLGISVRHRAKEIGIRKVMGATISNILVLLSAEYIKLTLIALLISIPTSYFLMQQWLEEFAYRIEIDWWMFILPGIAMLLITVFVVSTQSLRTALLNPASTLKDE
jgi:putative ABC transport system permease protein